MKHQQTSHDGVASGGRAHKPTVAAAAGAIVSSAPADAGGGAGGGAGAGAGAGGGAARSTTSTTAATASTAATTPSGAAAKVTTALVAEDRAAPISAPTPRMRPVSVAIPTKAAAAAIGTAAESPVASSTQKHHRAHRALHRGMSDTAALQVASAAMCLTYAIRGTDPLSSHLAHTGKETDISCVTQGSHGL